jgi:ribose transport system substrate-binding protein
VVRIDLVGLPVLVCSGVLAAKVMISVSGGASATKPAAVMIAPTDSHALIAPMENLKKAGIKVIQVDTTVADNSIASASISSNNIKGGELAAAQLAKQIGDKGSAWS